MCAPTSLVVRWHRSPVHNFKLVSVQLPEDRHMFASLSCFLSLCSLPYSNLREGKEIVPVCALVSLHAASRQISVCCSAPSPGKYPAEPRKRRLFHYITSERQKLQQSTIVDPEVSCMQNMVSACFSNLSLPPPAPAFAALQPESVSVLRVVVVLLWFMMMACSKLSTD